MTLKLLFYSSTSYWAWISIITSITIICNLLILISSRRQPKDRTNVKYLTFAAIINASVAIAFMFIPQILFHGGPVSEYHLFASYRFLILFLLHLTTIITYGVLISIFAKKNKAQIDVYLLIAGLSMIIAELLTINSDLIYYYILEKLIYNFNYPIKQDPLWIIYIIFTDLDTTMYTLSLVFFVIHGIKDKDFFIITAFILIIIRDSINGVLYVYLSQVL